MILLIARIISIIASPIVVTAPVSYALVFKTSNSAFYSLIWTIVSMLFAATVGLFVFYGVTHGIFSDYDISVRSERKPIFLFSAIISVLYLVIIFLLHGPTILMATLGALVLGVLIESFVNRKIKASIHLAVFSAFAAVLSILYGGIFWLLILLIPIVAWSRIKLKRHTFPETIIGALLGLSIVIILYYVVNYLIIIK